MKLPNADRAIIDEEKILNYVLDPLHREGRHHAELFWRLLGIGRTDWMLLVTALRSAAQAGEAIAGKASAFGTKYEIRFPMTGPRETHIVISVWMIRTGEADPRLVTAFVE